MLRPSAALLLSCILFTGCATRGGRIAAGATTMIVGGMFMASPGETTTVHPSCTPSPCNGVIDTLFTHEHTDHTPQVVGGLMLIAGAALFSAGLATHDAPAAELTPVPPAAPPPPVYAYGGYAPGYVAEPAPPAPVARPGQPAPNPAATVITSRIENRLAIQASTAAHAGHCSSAVITANKLAQLDPEMHVSLLEKDTELALCYAESPAH
jgi:hypothetical protein